MNIQLENTTFSFDDRDNTWVVKGKKNGFKKHFKQIGSALDYLCKLELGYSEDITSFRDAISKLFVLSKQIESKFGDAMNNCDAKKISMIGSL